RRTDHAFRGPVRGWPKCRRWQSARRRAWNWIIDPIRRYPRFSSRPGAVNLDATGGDRDRHDRTRVEEDDQTDMMMVLSVGRNAGRNRERTDTWAAGSSAVS